MAKFEQRFTGKANAGLRAEIRSAVEGNSCGEANAARIEGLRDRIALTAKGLVILGEVARDYREVGPEHSYRCDCDSCYAANMQSVGRRF